MQQEVSVNIQQKIIYIEIEWILEAVAFCFYLTLVFHTENILFFVVLFLVFKLHKVIEFWFGVSIRFS